MPIINPFWFYLNDVLNTLKEVGFFGTVILLSFIAILSLIVFVDCGLNYGMPPYYKQIFKKSIIILCMSLSVYILIPSKKTMYSIIVSDFVTNENVDKATNTIRDGVDYIVEKHDKDNCKGEKCDK